MKAFYVDLKRGSRLALLAGPFRDEPTARKYERRAVEKAMEIDPFTHFDLHGVISLEGEDTDKLTPGKINHMIDIDPADMLVSKAEWEKVKAMAAERREAAAAFDAEFGVNQ